MLSGWFQVCLHALNGRRASGSCSWRTLDICSLQRPNSRARWRLGSDVGVVLHPMPLPQPGALALLASSREFGAQLDPQLLADRCGGVPHCSKGTGDPVWIPGTPQPSLWSTRQTWLEWSVGSEKTIEC